MSTGQKNLNLKVKYRENFRPFAPSILKEDLSEWFDMNVESPYMLFVANIKSNKKIKMTNKQKELFGIDKLNIKGSEIPAVTHVDYTARVQTVSKEINSRFYDLISKFKPYSLPTKSNTAGASVAVVVSLEELLPPLHPRKSKKKIVDNSGEILCLALISNYKAISV